MKKSPIKFYQKPCSLSITLEYIVQIIKKRENRGRTDLERKSLADEREPHKGAVSEETEIEQKLNKIGENHRFSTLIFSV